VTDLPIRARGVIAFVLAGSGKAARVLLLKRRKTPVGAWCPVSGRIEASEAAWQTALREIAEETGIRRGTLFSTGVVDSFYDASENTLEMMPVFLLTIPREETVILDASQSESAWLDPDAALERLTFAGHRSALATIRRDFIEHPPDPLRRIASGD